MKITPIVKQTCEDFGIKYHYVDTITQALGCHIDHLRKLGQIDSAKVDWEELSDRHYALHVHAKTL